MGTFSGGAYPAPLTPRPTKTPDASNYINFTDPAFKQWSQQYLPEIYEKEVERYGKRTVGGFLRMVSAEMPMASDQVIWTEQGRLHLAFKSVASSQTATATEVSLTFGDAAEAALLAVGMTLVVADAANNVAKVRVSTAAVGAVVKVQVYGAADLSALAATGLSAFVFGFPPRFLYVAMLVLLIKVKNIIFIRKKKANYLLFFNNLHQL